MKATGVGSFKKTATCPSERILLSYTSNQLAHELMMLVKYHLSCCDFCSAELPLLSHYSRSIRADNKAPDVPMNLRILAESLLSQKSKVNVEDDAPDLILH